jgi:hypothetical protein
MPAADEEISVPIAKAQGTVLIFEHNFALEDAIGSHACSLETSMRVTNGMPLNVASYWCRLPLCRNTEGMSYAIFKEIDADNSGTINAEEFKVRCSCFTNRMLHSQVVDSEVHAFALLEALSCV